MNTMQWSTAINSGVEMRRMSSRSSETESKEEEDKYSFEEDSKEPLLSSEK